MTLIKSGYIALMMEEELKEFKRNQLWPNRGAIPEIAWRG
jgi:hypothetical protein